ncbi:hypothetical protein [Listeria seeligeri]|uniref:hypothetical protein n=1 Tax=Listeria seeligeri TaxID=1640 RepID=UPI00194227FE|nr:hypothetical protein [Listeria seeligeri]MBM5605261.1 hypothetical protein [Listeria seeligeri]MBM5676928.1 hypothetical protein [Listeria seeligeri]
MSMKYGESSFVYAPSESTHRFVSQLQHRLRLAIKINAKKDITFRSSNRYLEQDLKNEGAFFKVNPQFRKGDTKLKLFLFEDFKETESLGNSEFYEGRWFEKLVRPIYFEGGFDKIMQEANLEFEGGGKNNIYLPLNNINSPKEELVILRGAFENNKDTNLYEFLDYCHGLCE